MKQIGEDLKWLTNNLNVLKLDLSHNKIYRYLS